MRKEIIHLLTRKQLPIEIKVSKGEKDRGEMESLNNLQSDYRIDRPISGSGRVRNEREMGIKSQDSNVRSLS